MDISPQLLATVRNILMDLFNRSLEICREQESKNQSKPFDEIRAGPESDARRLKSGQSADLCLSQSALCPDNTVNLRGAAVTQPQAPLGAQVTGSLGRYLCSGCEPESATQHPYSLKSIGFH